jgi:transposase InsO family protein
MPFRAVDAMDSRKKLVLDVMAGCSLSQACREANVTRVTGRKWLKRALEVGIDELCEQSRAPNHVASKTAPETETALLELRQQFPIWGARKLVRLLYETSGITLATRTAEHILRRHGCTRPVAPPVPLQRFERSVCGSLLQMDFKGLPKSCPYSLLTVLDDYGRFCFAFEPLPDKSGPSVTSTLWAIFGRHGLPDAMLMDNGDCWGSPHSRSVTKVEAWLMLLGIKPIHGRVCHPQTQGKVERFHGTAKRELGLALVQKSAELVRPILSEFVERYNWLRPHDALSGAVPGSRYQPFPRPRPTHFPEHHIPEGVLKRKVDGYGMFSYKSKIYNIGNGLDHQTIAIQEDELGMRVFFAGFPLAYLHDL